MKKSLSVMLALTMMISIFSLTAFADPSNNSNSNGNLAFRDTVGHWGSGSIERVRELGIIRGYGDDTFRPDNFLSEAELAVMIDRLIQKKLNVQDDEDFQFDDYDNFITVPAWAKKSVNKGIEKKYLNMKRFNSAVQVDRLEACLAIALALEDAGLLLVDGIQVVTNPFADRGLLTDYEYKYILALYKEGYIKGLPDGNFNPNSFINRAHIASIIDNIFDDEDDILDNEKPYWVGESLTASAIGTNYVTLDWTLASDNVKVVCYRISYELNNTEVEKYVYSGRSVKITGLEADELYDFSVEARDAAGNWSIDGPSLSVRTHDAIEEDNEAPTWPATSTITFSAINGDPDSIALEWTEAIDNVKVTEYRIGVYDDDDVRIDTLISYDNDIIVSGLQEDIEYSFTIRAYDAAGNRSVYLIGYQKIDQL